MTYAALYALVALLVAIWLKRGSRDAVMAEAIAWPVMLAWWLCATGADAVQWVADWRIEK